MCDEELRKAASGTGQCLPSMLCGGLGNVVKDGAAETKDGRIARLKMRSHYHRRELQITLRMLEEAESSEAAANLRCKAAEEKD